MLLMLSCLINNYSFSDTVNDNGTEMGFHFLLNYLVGII